MLDLWSKGQRFDPCRQQLDKFMDSHKNHKKQNPSFRWPSYLLCYKKKCFWQLFISILSAEKYDWLLNHRSLQSSFEQHGDCIFCKGDQTIRQAISHSRALLLREQAKNRRRHRTGPGIVISQLVLVFFVQAIDEKECLGPS